MAQGKTQGLGARTARRDATASLVASRAARRIMGVKAKTKRESMRPSIVAQNWDTVQREAEKAGWERVETGMRRRSAGGRHGWSEDAWSEDALCLYRVRDERVEDISTIVSRRRAREGSDGAPLVQNDGPHAAEGDEKALSCSGNVQQGQCPPGRAHGVFDPGARAGVKDLAGAAAPAPVLPREAVEGAEFASLQALRDAGDGRPTTCVGFDSEWVTLGDGDRSVLSYQFAWHRKTHDGRWQLHELVILPKRLRLGAVGMWVSELPADFVMGQLLNLLGCRAHAEESLWKYGFVRRDHEPPAASELPRGWSIDKLPDGRTVTFAPAAQQALHEDNYLYHASTGAFDGHRTLGGLPERERSADEDRREWRPYDPEVFPVDPERITLVTHFGKVDVSALLDGAPEIMWHCADIGGLVTLSDFDYVCTCRHRPSSRMVYNVRLSVRDTMAQAPAGSKALRTLGDFCGVPKVRLSDGPEAEEEIKSHMDRLLASDPAGFLEYASEDAVTTVTYLAANYGVNADSAPTLASAGARAVRQVLLEELEGACGVRCSSRSEAKAFFDYRYRGVSRVEGELYRDERGRYHKRSRMVPVSRESGAIQDAAAEAYFGGFNSCMSVGFFDCPTHDYDLESAYPTAMGMVPDVDWSDPVQRSFDEYVLTEADLPDPTQPGLFRVSYRFPPGTPYPSILQRCDGVPVYTMRSTNADGGWAPTPDVWLAVRLGARVTCHEGWLLRPLVDARTGSPSHSLAAAVRQLVADRGEAKRRYWKGYIVEQVLKTIVNSLYGKTAQGISGKRGYNAWDGRSDDVAPSGITNPVFAAMTTSLVRCELIATMTQLERRGFKCFSVTTDGFITDAPLDALEVCDMLGLKAHARASRLSLTGDPTVWSEKHRQRDLLNFSTRGNVSLLVNGSLNLEGPEDEALGEGSEALYAGVCAHDSLRTGEAKDTIADRCALMRTVLGREGRVESHSLFFTSFRDLCRGGRMLAGDQVTRLSLDFDFKRRPVRSSVRDIHVDIDIDRDDVRHQDAGVRVDARTLSRDLEASAAGVHGTIACVDTEPYDTLDEFMRYREVAKAVKRVRKSKGGGWSSGCVRTAGQWDRFFDRVNGVACETGGHVSRYGMDWMVIRDCVAGYRHGRWDIPALHKDRGGVGDHVAWINDHNGSKEKSFTCEDWKNSGRPGRDIVLPVEQLLPKLAELGAIMPDGTPAR